VQNIPFVLPGDNGLIGVFISARAANLIDENSLDWMIQYNCNVIDDIKDFSTLK
jgi:hypothetical protein